MHNCYNMGFPCMWKPLPTSYQLVHHCTGFLPPEHLPVLHLVEGEGHCESTVDAFHYAKLTDQRSVGTPEENGTTFSD